MALFTRLYRDARSERNIKNKEDMSKMRSASDPHWKNLKCIECLKKKNNTEFRVMLFYIPYIHLCNKSNTKSFSGLNTSTVGNSWASFLCTDIRKGRTVWFLPVAGLEVTVKRKSLLLQDTNPCIASFVHSLHSLSNTKNICRICPVINWPPGTTITNSSYYTIRKIRP